MIPDWLSLIDILYVVIICLFARNGFNKGFSGQAAYVLTAFLGGILLFFVYPALFSYFGRVFRGLEEAYLMWLLLIGLGAVSIGLFILFSKITSRVIKTQMSDSKDAGWGLVFGLLNGVLVTLIMLILIVMLDRSGKTYDLMRSKSQVGKLVSYELLPRIQPRLTTLYENKVRDWKAQLMEREEAGAEVDF